MALAEDYKRLQYEFIAAKSLALQVVEKKLEMEESLRDQRQVSFLCVASELIFTSLFIYIAAGTSILCIHCNESLL